MFILAEKGVESVGFYYAVRLLVKHYGRVVFKGSDCIGVFFVKSVSELGKGNPNQVLDLCFVEFNKNSRKVFIDFRFVE